MRWEVESKNDMNEIIFSLRNKILIAFLFLLPVSVLVGHHGGYVGYGYYVLAFLLLCVFAMKIPINSIIFVFVMTLFSLCTLSFTEGTFGSAGLAMITVAVFLVFEDSRFTKFDLQTIKCLSLFVVLGIVANSFSWTMEEYRSLSPDQVTNPNTWGFYMAYFFMLWVSLTEFDSVKMKIIGFVVVVLVCIAFNVYSSRTSMLAFLVFLSLLFWERFRKGKALFFCSLAVIFLGYLIPFMYVVAFQTQIFDDVMFGIKGLYTGRQGIWLNMIKAFSENPEMLMIGLGSNAALWDESDRLNMHNSYLAIVVDFGVIWASLYMFYIVKKIYAVSVIATSSTVIKLLMSFICAILVMGIAEVSFGYQGSSLLSLFPLALALSLARNGSK